jgi:hypothetical protein
MPVESQVHESGCVCVTPPSEDTAPPPEQLQSFSSKHLKPSPQSASLVHGGT